MKLRVKDVRAVISEVVAERQAEAKQLQKKSKILESRASRIQQLITEKEGILSRLGNAFRTVNPSQEVDDPSRVQKVIGGSLARAQKIASSFEASALNTTKSINAFHDAVKDALDKVTSLGDTLGADGAADAQKQVVDVVRNFYALLKKEAERIDSFQQIIKQDLADKGMNPNTAYANTKGLKKTTAAAGPAKNPASKTFATNVQDPSASSAQSFRTSSPNPSRSSTQSFKTNI